MNKTMIFSDENSAAQYFMEIRTGLSLFPMKIDIERGELSITSPMIEATLAPFWSDAYKGSYGPGKRAT